MKQTIHFESQGLKCVAWLFLPEGEGPFPTVIMAHGLAAIKEMRLDAYAERFSAAGYACLVFDYRHFGESDGRPRQLLDIGKQHRDWLSAIEFARRQPNLDQKKIVLWGSSLSGGHVLKVASMAPDIAAVIAQVPHLSGFASLRQSSLSKLLTLTLHGFYDGLRGILGLKPHYVLSSAEPGRLALMNAPGESTGYLNLVPGGHPFDRRVSARFALFIGLYSPIRALPELRIPVLVQVGTQDMTTPAKPAVDVCPKCPNVHLKQYETGHFQPYVEPMFTTIVADQLEFLKETL
ncbi:alpha/beta hydrolase [Desulfosarcina widdelii]|uniref:Alpha/beta hydrolase n=1 Tax=Desulfosarcina widdelii TaxID=947919 RepID=A0A5K7Z2H5_9BACT|nr:alpha/beta hydrolase [Desulfosarcina widdelii]BBO74293.1 alpha/beta hydrolase [Desulfosarcina widdelii]